MNTTINITTTANMIVKQAAFSDLKIGDNFVMLAAQLCNPRHYRRTKVTETTYTYGDNPKPKKCDPAKQVFFF